MKKIIHAFLLAGLIFALWTGCKSKPDATDGESGGIRDIFAGVANVFILLEDDSLWGAGYRSADLFGQGEPVHGDQAASIRVARIKDDASSPFTGARAVAAGENHTVILKDDGTLWGAGSSANGELGQASDNVPPFTALKNGGAPLSGVKTAAAGNDSTFYVDNGGSLWAAGYNYYGELGLGNRDTQKSFARVDSAGQNVKAIAAGIRHTVVLKENGAIMAAGYNFNGQLGLGDGADRDSFTEVSGAGSDIAAVAAGNYHTVILKNDGSVWAAGSNYWGQIGFADNADRSNFARVTDENGGPLTGVREIAARGDITVLLKSDGSMLLAGSFNTPSEIDYNAIVDEDGQSAEKSSFVPLVPEQGASVKFGEVRKIVLGYNSVYVITSDNRLWAAGSNRYGQLNVDTDSGASSTLRLIEF